MIIGLGCIAHDDVLVTGATWAEGKGRISERMERFGGNVRNALVAIAAMGETPGYLATVGTSAVGAAAAEDLRAHGVSLDFVELVAGADPVSSTLVITSDGERFIAFDDSFLATTPLPGRSTVDAAMTQADVLLVDACTAPPGTLDVMEEAMRRGIPVVLDAERDPSEALITYVRAADHVIIPASFARQLIGVDDTVQAGRRLWQEGRAAVVLTDGSAGAHVWDGLDRHRAVPSFEVRAVDTTGCGDAFHGVYAWGLSRGLDLQERVRVASAAAAALAEIPSGSPRIPSRDRVVELAGMTTDTGLPG